MQPIPRGASPGGKKNGSMEVKSKRSHSQVTVKSGSNQGEQRRYRCGDRPGVARAFSCSARQADPGAQPAGAGHKQSREHIQRQGCQRGGQRDAARGWRVPRI